MPRRFSPDRYASSRRNNRREYNDDYEMYTSAPRRNRYEDDTYTPAARSSGYYDDTYTTRPSYSEGYEDEGYATERKIPSRTTRPSSNYYDDSNYEDYGEIGSNYDITSEPDYEEYEAESYDNYDDEGYAPEPKAPRRLDFSEAQTPRVNSSTPNRYGSAPSRLDFSNNDDLSKYMEYLDRYDRGDIDNHDMSRVQRRFANSTFWETFRPSRDMIQKYGSGDRSTRWPMFENKNGKWQPIIWRND